MEWRFKLKGDAIPIGMEWRFKLKAGAIPIRRCTSPPFFPSFPAHISAKEPPDRDFSVLFQHIPIVKPFYFLSIFLVKLFTY